MFFVFVYGSLRSGESNHEQMAGARLVSADSVALDAALIAYLEGYPGLVRSRGARTRGEVYEVDAAPLSRLDEFEGTPDQYQRGAVTLESGQQVETYWAAAPLGFPQLHKEEWPRSRESRPRPTWTKPSA